MKYFKKISGEKIYLSPMNLEDLDTYAVWLNDAVVSHGLGMADESLNAEEELEYFKNGMTDGDWHFSIVRQSDDVLLGYIGIQCSNRTVSTAEIKFFVGDAENRGKGYGTEALRLACRYAFDNLNIQSLSLWLSGYSEYTINTYKRVGFKETGRLSENYLIDGKYYDKILMELDKENMTD